MQGLETLSQLNGQANEDLSEREQQSLQDYPLSLRILAQDSGAHFWHTPAPFQTVSVLLADEPSLFHHFWMLAKSGFSCRSQGGV